MKLISNRCKEAREAGCFTCSGDELLWDGGNAQSLAANHARNNPGHETWADIIFSVTYRGESRAQLAEAVPA